jgi:hypothetical protein
MGKLMMDLNSMHRQLLSVQLYLKAPHPHSSTSLTPDLFNIIHEGQNGTYNFSSDVYFSAESRTTEPGGQSHFLDSQERELRVLGATTQARSISAIGALVGSQYGIGKGYEGPESMKMAPHASLHQMPITATTLFPDPIVPYPDLVQETDSVYRHRHVFQSALAGNTNLLPDVHLSGVNDPLYTAQHDQIARSDRNLMVCGGGGMGEGDGVVVIDGHNSKNYHNNNNNNNNNKQQSQSRSQSQWLNHRSRCLKHPLIIIPISHQVYY